MSLLQAQPTSPDASPTPDRRWMLLEGVSWDTYQRIRHETDRAGQLLQITFDCGRMVIMSPLPVHEKWKKLLARLVETLAEHRGMDIEPFGSTTWRNSESLKGLEADECYYIQRAGDVIGKSELDLDIDPPPDLAIEVDVTHQPIDRISIYATLGVPEVWRYDGKAVSAIAPKPGGMHVKLNESLAFPGFHPATLNRFMDMLHTQSNQAVVNSFREWLKNQGS